MSLPEFMFEQPVSPRFDSGRRLHSIPLRILRWPRHGMRRPPQFSLRTLFVVMTAIAVVLAIGTAWGGLGILIAAEIVGIAIGLIFIQSRPWLGTTIMIVAASFFLLLPPYFAATSGRSRGPCNNNLRMLGIALLNYHDAWGKFPPAYVADDQGNPIHSWRVLILPYMEEVHIYQKYRFDEPWDGPNNSKLHNQLTNSRYGPFHCPYDSSPPESTSYVAIVGPVTMWPGDRSTTIGEFTDGVSRTLMLVEVSNSGIHWMEPRDLDMTRLAATLRALPAHQQLGGNALFADGHVSFLDNQTAATWLEASATINGGESIDPQ